MTINLWHTYFTVDTTPSLKDLYEQITPRYAADWNVIGVLLDLPREELKAIELKSPNNVTRCCNFMLEKWLETGTATSWRHLFAVIDSPALSSDSYSNPPSRKKVKGMTYVEFSLLEGDCFKATPSYQC